MERLRARFPHTLVLAFAPAGAPAPSADRRHPRAARDHEIALDFVDELRGAPATDDESRPAPPGVRRLRRRPRRRHAGVGGERERLMRLHHLSVTAFGPFVETADVDFDALSDAGLFLLSGATGAGKSSVLDAVCFALYGAVPGDRNARRAAALRPGATRARALGDARGRRCRAAASGSSAPPPGSARRSAAPAPTREQAKVTVSERVDGEWVPLTSRLDEAGDLISGLLGMNLDQFCQVALLPQGHFQAFLRADSAQRHQLLARLFRTGRFERVEAWLARPPARPCAASSDRHAQVVGDLVSRLSEAARHALPEGFDDLASVVEDEVAEWAGAVRAETSARRTSAAAEAEQATVAHRSATAALAAAQDLARARTRVVAAAETMERLELVSERHAADVARLDRARRASGVTPLARLVDERQDAYDGAEQRAAASRAAAVHSGIDVATVPIELERASDELAALTALLPAERQVDELREQGVALLAQVEEIGRADELTRAELASLAALGLELREAVAAADAAAQAVPAAESELEHLRTVANAHEELVRLTAECSRRPRPITTARGVPYSICAGTCSTSVSAASPGWLRSSLGGWSWAATAPFVALPSTHIPRFRPTSTPTLRRSAGRNGRSTTPRPSSSPFSSGRARSRPRWPSCVKAPANRTPKTCAADSARPGDTRRAP